MINDRKLNILTLCFLLAESILYYLILTTGGTLLVVSSYLSIVLCFIFAVPVGLKCNPLIVGALACTLGADYFLVVHVPQQQLWGMVFFLGAQTLYAVHLHIKTKSKAILAVRIGLVLAAEGIAALVLREKLDPLAAVSMAYYALLLMNAAESFSRFPKNKLMPMGFVLFILCDTVIGLQVASGGYLPITEGSWLHNLLFSGFHLSWFFYLPSQVLIAMSAKEV